MITVKINARGDGRPPICVQLSRTIPLHRFFGVVYNKMHPEERLYHMSNCEWDTTFLVGAFCCTPLQKPVLWFYPLVHPETCTPLHADTVVHHSMHT